MKERHATPDAAPPSKPPVDTAPNDRPSPVSDVPSIGEPLNFAAAFQAAPIGMLILDRDLRYVACNDAIAEINGLAPAAHIGLSVREVLPDLAPLVEARFRSVFETGRGTRDIRVVGSTPKDPGASRVWLESISPLPGPTGQVDQILVCVQEITAFQSAETALRESERKFRASQQLSADSFAILRAVRAAGGDVVDFEWEYANPAAERAMGLGGLAGRRLGDVIPETRDHPAFGPRFKRLLLEPSPDEVEFESTIGGAPRLYRSSAVALDAERIAVAMQDLTDHLQKEDQLRLVTAEFRHRVKNVIAITLGLVSQTSRFAADVPGFSRALRERLHALAASQDLLLAGGDDVTLDEAVRTALQPFSTEQLDVDTGPPIRLAESSVSPLVVAVNELATNAVKYGALSRPEGQVRLRRQPCEGRVVLTWTETAGPPVQPAPVEGLGSRILAAAAANLPHGVLTRTFAPDGLHAEIAFDGAPEPGAGPSRA